MSSNKLSIDERDRLRRQADRQARLEERRARELKEEEAERDRLLELASKVLPDATGSGSRDLVETQQVVGHRRVGSGNLDVLLAVEEAQRSAQLERLIVDAPVNAAADGSKLRGLDAEIALRLKDKEDPELMLRAGKWIEALTNEPCFDLYACLKNGVALCKLVDAIKPGSLGVVGYNKRAGVHMAQRDNIRLYLQACEKLGMTSAEMFEISDLHENRNMANVVSNLLALSRRARFQSHFAGPFFEGPGSKGSSAGVALTTGSQRAPTFNHRRSRSDLKASRDSPLHASSISPASREVYKSSAPEAVHARAPKSDRKSRPPLPSGLLKEEVQSASPPMPNFCPQCGWDHIRHEHSHTDNPLSQKDKMIAQLRAQIDLLRVGDQDPPDSSADKQSHEDAIGKQTSRIEQLERENAALRSRLLVAENVVDDSSDELAAGSVGETDVTITRRLPKLVIAAGLLSALCIVGTALLLEPWRADRSARDLVVFCVQLSLGVGLCLVLGIGSLIIGRRRRPRNQGYSRVP